MSKVDDLIDELCPEGVPSKAINSICKVSRGRVMSKDYLRENAGEYPVYSSQTASNGVFGKINTYDYDGEYITWTTDGANAGSIFYRTGKFSITNVCGLLKVNSADVDSKYLTYILGTVAKKYVSSGMGNPKLMSNVMSAIKVPVPPLEVQKEIVNILDKFTQLEAELEAELEARRKQYEYYRSQLLTFDDSRERVRWLELGECVEKNTGGGTPSKAVSAYWSGDIPWASVGDLNVEGNMISTTRNFITVAGLKNSSTNLIPKGDVIVAVKISPGKMKIADTDLAINQDLRGLSLKPFLKSKFLTYYFQTINIVGNGTIVKGITVDTLNRVKIPVPSVEEQDRIVGILDKFDNLLHGISSGLPAELSARRMQYNYYRTKLLTFQEAAA